MQMRKNIALSLVAFLCVLLLLQRAPPNVSLQHAPPNVLKSSVERQPSRNTPSAVIPGASRRRRGIVPDSRLGPEFAHWEILSDRLSGVSKQQVLSSVAVCGDLMTLAAIEGEEVSKGNGLMPVGDVSLGINASLTNDDWPLLSQLGRLQWLVTRYGCDYSAMKLRKIEKQIWVARNFGNSSTWGSTPYLITEVSAQVGFHTPGFQIYAIRPIDVLIEAKRFNWTEAYTNFSAPWFTPSPTQLALMSSTSPLLVHYLSNEATHYDHGRVLPRWMVNISSSSQQEGSGVQTLSTWLKSVVRERRALHGDPWTLDEVRHALVISAPFQPLSAKRLNEARQELNMRTRYEALWAIVRKAKGDMTVLKSANAPPLRSFRPVDTKPHTTGQLAVALRNRFVRLSPSASPFFEEALIEGMLRAGNSEMEGVLSQAPPHVLSSHQDALSGHWNTSDVPPWLTLPSHVNVANCLDPLNQHMGAAKGQSNSYKLGDDLFQTRRSILLIGSSHAEALYLSLCQQYVHSRQMRKVPKRDGEDDEHIWINCQRQLLLRKHLSETFPMDEFSSPLGEDRDLSPIFFCQMRLDHLGGLEACAEALLQALGGAPPTYSPHAHNYSTGSLQEELLKKYPFFAHSRANATFSYTKFLLNGNVARYQRLKGIFSHIIFSGGPWELIYHDEAVQTHTETTAIILDLMEELFAPREKIILYNVHSYQFASKSLDQTLDVESKLSGIRGKVIPTFSGFDQSEEFDSYSESLKNDLTGPLPCTSTVRAAKFRDAQLLASWEPTRTRVRDSWKREYESLMANTSKQLIGMTDLLSNRAPIEIVDFHPSTAQGLAALLVDVVGHHYADSVIDAMVVRILRDHVCPPQYVMVETAPKMPGFAPLTNHARVSLPATFQAPPKLPTFTSKYLRARQSPRASTDMPTLSKSGNEIFNLFPLIKLPSAIVMEGLFSAVFENERSGRGFGVMYRFHSNLNLRSHPLVGSINQYDYFSISPHCSCLRVVPISYGVSFPTFFATQDHIIRSLSSYDGLDIFQTMRKWLNEIDQAAVRNNTPFNYSSSPFEFTVHTEPLSPQLMLRSLRGCQEYGETKLCSTCYKHEQNAYFSTLEALKIRMMAFSLLTRS